MDSLRLDANDWRIPQNEIIRDCGPYKYDGPHFDEGAQFNDMSWMKLLRDTEELGKLREFAAASLLHQAVIWGFKDNKAQVAKFLNVYAGTYGKDLQWYLTRSSKAPMLGDISAAKDLADLDYPKNSPDFIKNVAENCSQAGLFVSANKALGFLRLLGEGGKVMADSPYFRHVSNSAAYLTENNIDEVEVGKRIVAASLVVIELSGSLRQFNVYANKFGITFEFVVNADDEKLVDIDFAISQALSEQFEDTLSRHISIGTAPWQEAA